MAFLYTVIVASVAIVATADTFLAKSKVELNPEDVKQLLLSELSGHTDIARLLSIEDELRPMYASLPKGEQGRLEPATVRYALHRYFLHEYGWQIKGLDSAGGAWNASSATTLLKARAPAFILSLFQEHLQGVGMGLHELAVFAATVTDLIHSEAIGQLEKIWGALDLPPAGQVDQARADSAVHAFMVAYLLGGALEVESERDIQDMQDRLDYQYPAQNDTFAWVQDLAHTHDLEQRSHRNPFVEPSVTFDDSAAFALQFSHNFGSFQNLECHRLKRKLVEMEHVGTGRVLLTRFYANALGGDWEFMESVEYLRNQGALDESDPNYPSVVIPNYLNSRMNCLTASDFYAICCLNECDELLARLEGQLALPSAEPGRIAEVVSHVQSDTVDAPRNLSAALLDRLNEIAVRSESGLVPLHGRLFAQWMHHAYPRECPFPHLAGAVKPMYPEEWAIAMGEDLLEVSQEVMEEHAARSPEQAMSDVLLPWTHEEELVARHQQVKSEQVGHAFMKMGVAIVALVSFAAPLVHAFKAAFATSPESKFEKQLV